MTLESLRSAEEDLEEAYETASLGTRMMVSPILTDLRSLIERTESIENDRKSEE